MEGRVDNWKYLEINLRRAENLYEENYKMLMRGEKKIITEMEVLGEGEKSPCIWLFYYSEFSREKETIGCIPIKNEIYYKELDHVITKAGKFKICNVWASSLEI